MARTKAAERARKRVLGDQEIRDLWTALDMAEVPSCYPAYVRTLLLTGQRRKEVVDMRWEEIEGGNVWIIPGERRKKGDANTVPFADAVSQLLGKAQKNGYVFSITDRSRPFSDFSKAKRALDRALADLRKKKKREPMPPWVLSGLMAQILDPPAGNVVPLCQRGS